MAGGVRRIADGLARALGWRVLPRQTVKYQYEIDLLGRLLAHFRVDCVFDVGANRGQYRDLLREQVGYRGLVVSVEPQAALVEQLRARAASDPHWRIEAGALGPAPGAREFRVMAADVFSSFLEPEHAPDSPFREANRVVRTETVQVGTLDLLLPAIERDHGVRRHFLKLDTQGFDLEVLAGAREVLARVAALQVEVSFRALYRGMPDWAETVRGLGELGYDVAGFTPIAPKVQFPRAFEMNCLCVNRRLLEA